MTSFPDIIKVPIKPEHEFFIVACDGIWDCFSNEQAVKFVRTKKEKGPKQAGPLKQKSLKGLDLKKSATSVGGSSKANAAKAPKKKGETSFIIEEMMNQGIAKGDIMNSDGTGTDNMTCILVYFRDPSSEQEEVKTN